MKMEIGEYIRTRLGISKIIGDLGPNVYEVDKNGHPMKNKFSFYVRDDEILNHSQNVIYLIKVGDYVNGKLIHYTDIRKNSAYIYYGNGKTFVDYQIKSIVTKEQFESMQYKLEAEDN